MDLPRCNVLDRPRPRARMLRKDLAPPIEAHSSPLAGPWEPTREAGLTAPPDGVPSFDILVGARASRSLSQRPIVARFASLSVSVSVSASVSHGISCGTTTATPGRSGYRSSAHAANPTRQSLAARQFATGAVRVPPKRTQTPMRARW